MLGMPFWDPSKLLSSLKNVSMESSSNYQAAAQSNPSSGIAFKVARICLFCASFRRPFVVSSVSIRKFGRRALLAVRTEIKLPPLARCDANRMPAIHRSTAAWESPTAHFPHRLQCAQPCHHACPCQISYGWRYFGQYSIPQSHSGSFVARCMVWSASPFESRIGPSFASSQAACPTEVLSSKSCRLLSAGGSFISANAIQYRKAAFRVSSGDLTSAKLRPVFNTITRLKSNI